MHWFPFYSSDFIGATVGLSCLERSLYALMLPLYYEVGPFPQDAVRTYRVIGCESDEQKRAVDFLLQRFFVLKEDGWYQPRAEKEKTIAAQIHGMAVERGRRSAIARKEKYGTAQPERISKLSKASGKPFESVSRPSGNSLEPSTTTTTSTTTKEQVKPSCRPADDAAGFVAFWKAFPHYSSRSSKAETRKVWQDMKLEPIAEQVLKTLSAMTEQPDWKREGGSLVPGSQRWLRKRLWEQEIESYDPDAALMAMLEADPRLKGTR